jgi:hypothetical protein
VNNSMGGVLVVFHPDNPDDDDTTGSDGALPG